MIRTAQPPPMRYSLKFAVLAALMMSGMIAILNSQMVIHAKLQGWGYCIVNFNGANELKYELILIPLFTLFIIITTIWYIIEGLFEKRKN